MGGVSTGSMVKHLQQHDDAQNLKIAFISEQNKFIEPTNYFPIVHGHQNDQKAESYTIQAVIDKWSKLEIGNPVTSINAEGNSLTLENGKEFTYKSLVMAPGLNHSMEGIKGLAELADEDDLEHSEILAAKGVTPEEVRHPNALNRIENYVAPEIAAGHWLD